MRLLVNRCILQVSSAQQEKPDQRGKSVLVASQAKQPPPDDLYQVRRGPAQEATPASGTHKPVLICCTSLASHETPRPPGDVSALSFPFCCLLIAFTWSEGLIEEHEFSGSSSGAEDVEPPSDTGDSDLSSEPDFADEQDDSGEFGAGAELEGSDSDPEPGKLGKHSKAHRLRYSKYLRYDRHLCPAYIASSCTLSQSKT